MTLNEATTTLSNKFETLEELKKLIILGGQLEIIKNDTFTSANNKLRHVQISSCSIFFIEPKTFANLTDLWYLDLSNNSLMRIAPGTFDGLSNLEVLKLQKNNIYKIKESTLNDLVNLYRFDICDNDLTEISNEIFYNTKIEYLYLRNNRLKIIQKELFNYTNSTLIKEIDLQNNYIDRIEKGAFAGLNLDVLDLAKNKLQVITNGIFQGCLGILELNISVKLGEYDTTISDESISWIIPYAFKETRTKTLSLNFAKGLLTIEPECFKGLEQITTLDLSSEKKLGNLDLSNNSLMRITPGTFDGLSKLETLNLENNNIYKIKEATLNELVIND
ncbi:toll-like receptor 3 [Aphidius gifuensis]|uniref:toll-like receptor 3 n=1 Tax=Aphidius gifuensis TaxID=684658 RepID=UPI001CDB542D|nr:toll-like receptor 3 [Aphidius gifuensis]